MKNKKNIKKLIPFNEVLDIAKYAYSSFSMPLIRLISLFKDLSYLLKNIIREKVKKGHDNNNNLVLNGEDIFNEIMINSDIDEESYKQKVTSLFKSQITYFFTSFLCCSYAGYNIYLSVQDGNNINFYMIFLSLSFIILLLYFYLDVAKRSFEFRSQKLMPWKEVLKQPLQLIIPSRQFNKKLTWLHKTITTKNTQ